MSSSLPSFQNPPVIETALSVQFKPLRGFANAHLGLFWDRIRREFPKTADADPILPQEELFGDQILRRPRLPSFRIVAGEGAARLQMISEDNRAMVQLQNGRLAYNWRRMVDGEYPRWRTVMPKFESARDTLADFLSSEGLGEIEPNQWEGAYVNHLTRGRDWEEASDWSRLIPGLIGTAGVAPVGKTESVGCNWRFALPEDRGRLHIDLFHGFSGAEQTAEEVLVLQLTARGGVKSLDGWGTAAGLEIGHAAIVRTFAAITGAEAHNQWERET